MVRGWEFSASFSCQKPEFASSFMNSLECPISPRRESIFGSGYVFLHTLSYSFGKSTHILTLLSFDLGTVTIPVHYSVGCLTFLITQSFSILASSTFYLGLHRQMDASGCSYGDCFGIWLQMDFIFYVQFSESMEKLRVLWFGFFLLSWPINLTF